MFRKNTPVSVLCILSETYIAIKPFFQFGRLVIFTFSLQATITVFVSIDASIIMGLAIWKISLVSLSADFQLTCTVSTQLSEKKYLLISQGRLKLLPSHSFPPIH